MSKQLTPNGYIVGSDEYFRNINNSTFLGAFMSDNYDYKQALSIICENISNILDEIYRDLSSNSKILRYVDSANLKNTASFKATPHNYSS